MPIFGVHPAGLMEKVLEDVGAGIAIIDKKGTVAFANKVCVEMFGGIKSETPVVFCDWCKKYHFEDPYGHEIRYEDFPVTRALQGETVGPQEFRLRLPNGDTRWFVTSAYAFSTMGLSGVLALIIDDTAEVELRNSTAELQKMERLGLLAACIAHDFNNLLNTISCNVTLALDSSREIHARLQQISAASDKAAGLVRRLMQFSHTQKLDIHKLQLNQIVRESLHLAKPLFREDIAVTTDFAETLPDVEADPSQVEQLVLNLIVNALDAMPMGGRLTISTTVGSNGRNELREGSTQSVVLSVADTGVGIPSELQSAIFEPFFTTKPFGKGTGLGLSSAYGIMRQHGGNIKVESTPGKGATFTVIFPLKASPLPFSR